ncbi:HET-domain-containing protein [Polyplosphaeria fusca]|uniref:HET-domain-containing protein n=1 Tax=Polyplosphaeria fusca TaxID=682080 RepID=A0A9P4R0E9_9PLEO|nr:HET-domain-containing protein [Polyplosphaeria fusca]
MASKKRKLGDDGNSSHVYQPLLGSDHIRVLVLEPSDDTDSPLCGSFHEASLKDLSGKYEAISYTWGKPILSYPVHTGDGSQVFVTENLDNALRRFRKKKARWLWVDALCINQIDSAEKAVQIPFMADIFRAATRVLAWLGPGTGGEDGIIRSLPRAAKLQEATPAAAIEQLLSLPWFSRVWIVQEIIANAQLMIVCGSSKISWVTFLEAISYCGIDAKEGEVIRPGFAAMRRIIRTWVKRHFPTTNNTTARDGGLLNLMTDFSNFSCSNSRDRIFAIYSLANDTTTGPIELPSRNVSRDSLNPISMVIDYSQSIQETYTRLATALVEAGRDPRLANVAPRLENEDRIAARSHSCRREHRLTPYSKKQSHWVRWNAA